MSLNRIAKALASLVAVASFSAGALAAPPTYRITDIGLPDGHYHSRGISLNDRGEVIASSLVGKNSQLYAWSASTGIQPWHRVFISPAVAPEDLNKSGQVGGFIEWYETDPTRDVGFVWRPDTGTHLMDALIQDRGNSQVIALNNQGAAVGWYDNGNLGSQHAFLWTLDGGMVDIHPHGYQRSLALALNERGQVLASVYTAGARDGAPAVLSRRVGPQLLPCQPLVGLPLTYCYATAINDRGQVAGQVTGGSPQGGFWPVHPVIWNDARSAWLDISAGSAYADAKADTLDINRHGQVVGRLQAGNGFETFYWDAENGMHKVEDLIDPADPLKDRFWAVGGPSFINAQGMILMNVHVLGDTVQQRPILLTPVP